MKDILLNEDGTAWNGTPYEWKTASVTVAGTAGTTNITGITGFTTLFATVPRAHHITVEADGTAYIRLNAATNDKITVTATTPFSSDFIVVDKLFISTNGAGVTTTVKLR